MDKQHLNQLAVQNRWKVIPDTVDGMMSFRKKDMRINVWYRTGTVATCINHPVKGKTQLFRRGVDYDLMDKIFKNPRIHTNKGYQKTRPCMYMFREIPE